MRSLLAEVMKVMKGNNFPELRSSPMAATSLALHHINASIPLLLLLNYNTLLYNINTTGLFAPISLSESFS